MTCGRERLEEVIGMRKIGYPVGEKVMRGSTKCRETGYPVGEKVMRKSMKQ